MPVPAAPEDITPNWLTSALGRAGALTRGSVVAATWTTIGEEYGWASVLGRLDLRLNGANAGAPSSLVAKLSTPEYSEHAAREVEFYRRVEPAPSPTVYHGATNGDRAILLLEDLTHARQGDALEGCSIEDARAVLAAIAPFHARYWDRASAVEWLARKELDPQARQARFGGRMDRFVPAMAAPFRRTC